MREEGFSVGAWMITVIVGSERRDYCIDAGLTDVVVDSIRRVLFVFPSSSCHDNARYTIREPRKYNAEDLFSMILDSCRDASKRRESLRKAATPRPFSLALFGKPSKAEMEYVEARNAALLCEQLFGSGASSLASWKPAFLNYTFGKGMEWKRLALLSRIDPGMKSYLQRLGEGLGVKLL